MLLPVISINQIFHECNYNSIAIPTMELLKDRKLQGSHTLCQILLYQENYFSSNTATLQVWNRDVTCLKRINSSRSRNLFADRRQDQESHKSFPGLGQCIIAFFLYIEINENWNVARICLVRNWNLATCKLSLSLAEGLCIFKLFC